METTIDGFHAMSVGFMEKYKKGLASSQIFHLPKWRGLTSQELHVIAVNDTELDELLNMRGQLQISKSPEKESEE